MRKIGTIGSVAGLSHYERVPHQKSTFVRLAAPLLVACVLALVAAPSTAATKTAARAAAPASSGHSRLSLEGDTAQPAANARRAHKSHKARKRHKARRASFAWTGRTILYTEAIPSKWDWSLSNAIAKWNSAGGGIQFVKANNPRKARLTIAYGNIGSAAGLATVGRSRHASVRLSSRYSGLDSLDAHNRVEVLGIFTHELGHVLGFEHTSARCSLMSPVLDVDGCGVLPLSMPGFYKCRTIDGALANRFVKVYGGHARYPSAYCPIDPLPVPVTRVAFAGGVSSLEGEAPTPVTVSWARPSAVPAGSHVEIRSWTANTCGAVPGWADTAYAPVAAGVWQDPQDATGATCYRVQLVNRYGAGRTAVSRLMFR